MQRVPKEYRRDKTLGVAINDMEISQLTELAKWYFKWGIDDKKSRKGACLLARLFIENEMKKMLSEMQLEENSHTITTGA